MNVPRKPLNDFSKQWDMISKQFMSHLKVKLDAGQNYIKAIDATFKELHIQDKFKAFVLDTVTASYLSGISGNVSKPVSAIKKSLLGTTWPGSKLTLSSRINNVKLLPVIKDTIRRQLNENNAIQKLAKSLTDQKLTVADIPKHIKNLEQQATRVFQGDSSGIQAFKKAINRSAIQIESLKGEAGTVGSARLKKAYTNVITQVEKLSQEGLDKAIERAINAKARYNAERIARNEATKAWATGTFEKLEADPDVVGWELTPSSAHGSSDECDSYFGQVFAMGEGPDVPVHINCVTGDSRVWWDQELQGITKFRYCGDIIEIILKCGKHLSVTPNHLIMTSNGWVAAKDIKKFDKVVTKTRLNNIVSSTKINNNYVPPKIKDVFKSFILLGSTSTQMPLTSKDFHGDGIFNKSKVDIIDVNSFLGNNFKTTFDNIIKLLFISTIVMLTKSFKSLRMFKFVFNRLFLSSKYIMRTYCTSLTSSFIKFIRNKLLFRSSSFDSKLYENQINMMSPDIIPFSKRLSTMSEQIQLSDVVDVIIRKNVGKNNSVHVYDIQCDNIYFCNDVLTHNCLCGIKPVFKTV